MYCLPFLVGNCVHLLKKKLVTVLYSYSLSSATFFTWHVFQLSWLFFVKCETVGSLIFGWQMGIFCLCFWIFVDCYSFVLAWLLFWVACVSFNGKCFFLLWISIFHKQIWLARHGKLKCFWRLQGMENLTLAFWEKQTIMNNLENVQIWLFILSSFTSLCNYFSVLSPCICF